MNFWQGFESVLHYPLLSFGKTQVTLLSVLDFCLVLLLALVVAKLTQWLLKRRIFQWARFDPGVQYMVARILSYFVFALGFFIGLNALGIDLTSFTVIAGALGVGIGFGLQNIVNNFISGIIVLSERLIQLGDRIEVGGVSGYVEHIGARCVSLKTTENLIVYVPNGEIISKAVTRWGREERYPYRLEVKVEVVYGTDLKKARQLMMEVLLAHPDIVKEPAPFVTVLSLGEKGIACTLSFFTFEKRFQDAALKTEVFMSVVEAFHREGIALATSLTHLCVLENKS